MSELEATAIVKAAFKYVEKTHLVIIQVLEEQFTVQLVLNH